MKTDRETVIAPSGSNTIFHLDSLMFKKNTLPCLYLTVILAAGIMAEELS
jgi:hypothetical protein